MATTKKAATKKATTTKKAAPAKEQPTKEQVQEFLDIEDHVQGVYMLLNTEDKRVLSIARAQILSDFDNGLLNTDDRPGLEQYINNVYGLE